MLDKIFNEDNLITMARMKDETVDLILTSPPYADIRAYNGFHWDFEKMVPEMLRIIKPGGVVVWVVGDKTEGGTEMLTPSKQALTFNHIGFFVHDTMIFEAGRPPKTHNRYEQDFEFMFIFSKDAPKTFNPLLERTKTISHRGGFRQGCEDDTIKKRNTPGNTKLFKIRGNIWRYHVGSSSAETKKAHEHPAIFPLQLAIDHIKSWTNEGDLVYDPFMGSGTTAIAAIKTRRKYIGSEISSKYTQIINSRIERFRARVPGFFGV